MFDVKNKSQEGNRMRKCLIWGLGREYERILNSLLYETAKGNIQIEALVTKPEDVDGKTRDGYPIVHKKEIPDIEFDYLIITSDIWYNEICKEAMELGVSSSKIFRGTIFKLALFDFQRYVQLVENPITLLSDDCWGGMMYHALYLPFTSPTINIWWPRGSYCKFVTDIEYYMREPLLMVREGDIRKNYYPIGKIGEGEKAIELHFTHNIAFQDAWALWERRKKRVNFNNLFVKMGFDHDEHSKEYLKVFDSIPYKKVCFYSSETDIADVIYLKRFERYIINGGRDWTISVNYNDFCRKMELLFKSIDVLKMLNGEENYLRDI